jgi:hypothetical protein
LTLSSISGEGLTLSSVPGEGYSRNAMYNK